MYFTYRAHDVRITCQCATAIEIPEDIKSDIEAIVNSCTRNKYVQFGLCYTLTVICNV